MGGGSTTATVILAWVFAIPIFINDRRTIPTLDGSIKCLMIWPHWMLAATPNTLPNVFFKSIILILGLNVI